MIISNKNKKVEKFFLNFILIMGLLSSYVEFFQIWNLILLISFIIVLLLSSDFRKSYINNVKGVLFLILILIFIFFNIMFTNEKTFVLGNFLQLLKTFIIASSIMAISQEDNSFFKDFILNKFKLLNFFWIANLVVLILQCLGTGFMIKSSWLSINSYYLDQCSGLFGNSGTHILALFSVFIFIYNMYYVENSNSKHKKNINIYNIITAIIMIICSTFNDNNAIFILYGLFISLYYISMLFYQKKTLSKKMIKIIFLTTVAIVTLVIIYNIPIINSYINNTLLKRIDLLLLKNNQSALGSNERLAIYQYALDHEYGWKLGTGFGSWGFDMPNFHGFPHFGISSIGTITMLTGIWFYLLLTFMFSRIFSGKINIKFLFYFILIAFLIVILSIFTPIMTTGILIIWCSLIFSLVYEYKKGSSIK